MMRGITLLALLSTSGCAWLGRACSEPDEEVLPGRPAPTAPSDDAPSAPQRLGRVEVPQSSDLGLDAEVELVAACAWVPQDRVAAHLGDTVVSEDATDSYRRRVKEIAGACTWRREQGGSLTAVVSTRQGLATQGRTPELQFSTFTKPVPKRTIQPVSGLGDAAAWVVNDSSKRTEHLYVLAGDLLFDFRPNRVARQPVELIAPLVLAGAPRSLEPEASEARHAPDRHDPLPTPEPPSR